MRLIHDIDRSISLHDDDREPPLWRYVYRGQPKPFFHPLCTPAGHVLSNFEPHDHLWHRGLWFTIKFVSGENFWEERESFGTQRTIGRPGINHEDDGRINLFTRIDWMRGGRKGAVLREQRQITHVPMGDDAYALDFYTTLVAQTDLTLDRTPYTTWGGYGGLAFRGTRNWQQTRMLLSDGSSIERLTGEEAKWADLSGKLDGGPQQSGGVAIFDHPANVRHPSPWYGGAGDYNFLNAALLFHEPLEVEAEQTLSLRYRVLVHDGMWDQTRLQSQYNDYAE